MADVEVTSGGRYKLILDRIKDPRTLMTQIGAMLASRAQQAFVDQRRGKENWSERMVPNIAGIVDD